MTMHFTDENGVSWRNQRERLLGDFCELCGCHNDELAEDVVAVLFAFDATQDYLSITDLVREQVITGSEKYVELILHVLDHAGLLEHGNSIRGSWLTPKGRRMEKATGIWEEEDE